MTEIIGIDKKGHRQDSWHRQDSHPKEPFPFSPREEIDINWQVLESID